MEKPNFERVTKAIRQWRSLRDEIIIEELVKEWEIISKMESKYIELPLLEDLLRENKLEIMLPDFLLMGFHFIVNIKRKEENKQEKPSKNEIRDAELYQTLDLLLNNDTDISIEIYRNKIHQVSIQDTLLIKTIKEGLLDRLEKYSFRYYWDYELDIDKDWRKFIKERLMRMKNDAPKKGRPNETSHIKPLVFSLWNYLQNNTELKAENGTIYSRRQAMFIFQFLKIHKLIDQSISYKEDVIGYYLKSYIKSRKDFHQKIIAISKSRDIEKEKIEIEEFLAKYEKDYRLTPERKKDLQKHIKYLEKILANRKNL